MKFLAICFLSLTCWLLYERIALAKDLEAANIQIEKMNDLQKRFDAAQG